MHDLAVRTLIALFTVAVFLLVQSVFWSTSVSTVMAVATIGLIVIAYFRPHNALLVLAAIAPLGGVWSPFVGGRMRGAEALVLAFFAGALFRGWTLHRFRHIALGRLQIAALLLGTIVALSCAHQLWLREVDPRDLVASLGGDYVITSARSYTAVPRAMLLIEGLGLLLYAMHYCFAQQDFRWRLARMLVIGGIAAASFNVLFFVHELIETGQPAAHFQDFFVNRRWTAHVSDVNAAGSFFAMVLFIPLGLSVTQKTFRTARIAAGLSLGLALWMTGSRTALVATLAVGVICLARLVIARSHRGWRSSAIAIAALTVGVVAAALYLQSRYITDTASQAMDIRWEFLKTTWRMIEAHPWFGVGIGQYHQSSAQYSSAALLAIYPRENAHNYFAQVAGELGLIGLTAFVGLLAVCFWPPNRSHHDPVVAPVIAGLAAFIISWLGGHPLLIPEVAYPFWLALAIVARSAEP